MEITDAERYGALRSACMDAHEWLTVLAGELRALGTACRVERYHRLVLTGGPAGSYALGTPELDVPSPDGGSLTVRVAEGAANDSYVWDGGCWFVSDARRAAALIRASLTPAGP